jgi:hypothetical protein
MTESALNGVKGVFKEIFMNLMQEKHNEPYRRYNTYISRSGLSLIHPTSLTHE